MKSLKIAIILMVCANKLFAQTTISGNDTVKIYIAVLGHLNLDEKKVFVLKETYNDDLKNFKFNHIENYLLGNKGFELYRDSSWKDFLFSIDTSRINSYHIYLPIHAENINLINKKEVNFREMLVNPLNVYGIVYFSPIILSQDKRHAVLTVKTLRPSEGASQSAIFIENNNNTWDIRRTILLSIQ